MIALRITVDARGFDSLGRRLPLAIARGLNEGGDKVRTEVQRGLKAQTNVKLYRSITSRMKDSGRGFARAAPGRLVYQIIATGKGIPIAEFPVSGGAGSPVDAQTWGVDHVFKRSFGIKGRGVDGFRARLGAKRFPIRKLYGPALPKELMRGKIPALFYEGAALYVPPALMKRLAAAFG